MLPPAVVQLAEAQLGVVARHQLRRSVPDHVADALLHGAWLERLDRGVYRVVGGARLPQQRAIAATLRAGSGACLTGPVVLALLGIDGFRGDEPFEVLVPPGRRLSGIDFPVRRDPDPARPVGQRGEVRLVGPIDALIDSAAFADELGARRIRLAHDVLRWRGLLAPGRLTERITALGRSAPGGSELAGLLDLDLREATGDGERRLGELLARFEPPPEPQVWVTPNRRVDWWFRSVRYGWEYQGSVDHGTRVGRTRDAERDAELRRDGIRLGYIDDADLRDETALLATVAGALAARAHELGVAAPRLRGG